MYETITGLDIGTSKIAAVIAQRVDDNQIEIKGIGIRKSTGVQRGIITNLEATTRAMVEAVEDAETQAGLDSENVFISISGAHIRGQNERGLVTISDPSKEIRQEDLERVVDQAQRFKMPADRKILHVLPIEFTVDGQGGIDNPVMMSGVRLEASCHIITGATTPISNLTRCIEATDLDARELAYTGLAAGEGCLSEEEKRIGVVLIDIGAGKTDIAFFRHNQLAWMMTLPVGGSNVTRDLAAGIRTSESVAERLKIESGTTDTGKIAQAELVEIPGMSGRKPTTTTRMELAQFIEPRMRQIFHHASMELDRTDLKSAAGAGMVLTGGGSLLDGALELAESCLTLPARIGYPVVDSALEDQLHDPRFVTAVGLTRYALYEFPDEKESRFGSRSQGSGDRKTLTKVAGFFKGLFE